MAAAKLTIDFEVPVDASHESVQFNPFKFKEPVFLFIFGCVNSDMGWPVALVVLLVMSTFINMAEGTSYAIFPYNITEQLPIVCAIVGAGGTLGAVIATRLCYMTTNDELLPFSLHAGYVLFWALTVVAMWWENLGSMLGGAKQLDAVRKTEKEKAQEAERAQAPPNALAVPAKKDTVQDTQTLPEDV